MFRILNSAWCSVFVANKSFSVASGLLHMRRQVLLFALEPFRHAVAQQRGKSDLCLDPGELLNVFLATATSERGVHLFEGLATGLGDEEPVEGKCKY
jgi:hypothetical protein